MQIKMELLAYEINEFCPLFFLINNYQLAHLHYRYYSDWCHYFLLKTLSSDSGHVIFLFFLGKLKKMGKKYYKHTAFR
jgi:hypothetical protein